MFRRSAFGPSLRLDEVVEMHILDNIASSRPAADFQPFWKTGTGQEMMQAAPWHLGHSPQHSIRGRSKMVNIRLGFRV